MMFEKELNKDSMSRITSAEYDGEHWFNFVSEKNFFKQLTFKVDNVTADSVHYSEWIDGSGFSRLTAIVKANLGHEFDVEFHGSPDGGTYGGWMHGVNANGLTIAHKGDIFLNYFQFVIRNKDAQVHSYDVFIRLYKW